MDKNYNLSDVLEFARLNIPNFDKRMEMFLAKPKDLIGRKVRSIKAGFSHGVGQIMIVDDVEEKTINNKHYKTIKLKMCEETITHSKGIFNPTWSCDYSERSSKLIFYDDYIRCFDKFGNEIHDGDYLDVQSDGIHRVYKKSDGQLYFKPYGKEDMVSSYFSNDMVLCDKDGNWDLICL